MGSGPWSWGGVRCAGRCRGSGMWCGARPSGPAGWRPRAPVTFVAPALPAGAVGAPVAARRHRPPVVSPLAPRSSLPTVGPCPPSLGDEPLPRPSLRPANYCKSLRISATRRRSSAVGSCGPCGWIVGASIDQSVRSPHPPVSPMPRPSKGAGCRTGSVKSRSPAVWDTSTKPAEWLKRGFLESSHPAPHRELTMADVAFVVVTIAVFALVAVVAKGVAKL